MKKFKKLIVIAALSALSLMTLIGCSGETKAPTPSETIKTDDSSTQSVETLLPTQDREGNPIEIPETINRIVSTAPSNTEILIELGLGDKLVGIDKWSSDIVGLPTDLSLIDFQNPDAEAIIGLTPDILIASGHNRTGSDDPFALIKESGISVVYLPTSDSIEGIYGDVEFLGALTGTSDKAIQIIDDMKSRVSKISETAAKVTEPKKVYFEVNPAPYLSAVGDNTFLNDFIETIGAVNIFGDQEPWFSPSPEAIIKANPDIIITNATYMENATDEIKSREGWEVISAVQNDNVYLIDANTSSRASHLSINALEDMAKAIYPDLYE